MSPASQRLQATLSLAGNPGEILVHSVRGQEEVSRPFRYEVDFSTDNLELDAARGASAQLHLQDVFGNERFVGGAVEAVSVLASSIERTRFRVVLVPLPHLVSYRHGFGIFQDKDVPEIVKQVFTAAGLDPKLFHWELSKKYPKRPYCAQYDETDWSFISRLLEEEGIYYAFEQSAEGCVMIFRDDSSSAATAGELPFRFDSQLHGQAVRAWDVVCEERASISKVTLNDYDRLKPSLDLAAHEEVSDKALPKREWYEYPGRYGVPAEGKRLARVRLEELRCQRKRARARTNAIFVAAGTRVKLAGHPSADGEYFVDRVEFRARIDSEEGKGPLVDPGPQQCQLALELLPGAQPFRPARATPRPSITGLQTARVTGPSSEEIHCDEHGRVKVQFHWDRRGKLDDKSSCWIRVVQAHTTGSVMIPRVGWEVLVEFVHGDPDRPLCHGRLYNPLFTPPYELPAQKTVSGHRSMSSPGGRGTNEVKFDDAGGSQQLAIHAQKDMNVKVAHDKKAKVTKNEERSVGLDRTVIVGAEEKISVSADDSTQVGGSQSIRVGAMRTVTVSGEASETVKGNIQLSVGGAEMMQVGNPARAVLDIITAAAIEAARGAAAGLVDRAQGALLAPIAPVLNTAKAAIGGTAKISGAAGALLSGNPVAMASALGIPAGGSAGKGLPGLASGEPAQGSAGRSTDAGGARPADGAGTQAKGGGDPMAAMEHASSMAAGAAGAIASGALGKLGLPTGGAKGGAGGGSGGDGGGNGAGGATGSGLWGTAIGGSVTENIGAVAAINSVMPIAFAIGGTSIETVGAARIELIGGSKSETTGIAKKETVGGLYLTSVSSGISVEAGAALAENIAGTQRQKIGNSHAISSKGPALVTVSRLKLKASEKITLKCGQAEVVISSDGVDIKGMDVTVKGAQELKLDPPAIGPG